MRKGSIMYENLLSPNEFANISGNSRQTLLFYERKNVFKPILKNEKGFRFYSLEQLDVIVTIQGLQTIGLSLREIQDYIENRNAELIYELYSSRLIPLKQTVQKYNRMIEMMNVKLELIKKAKSVLLDTIYLEYRPAIQIIKSKEIPLDASDTIQYKILGEHMEYRKVKDYSLGHAVAGIVDWKRAIESMTDKTQYRYYYTILPSSHEETDYSVIESGTYIVIYHKGPYNQTYEIYPKIIEYVKENHFEIESTLYEESLIDETTESDPNNYITQISVRIKEIF